MLLATGTAHATKYECGPHDEVWVVKEPSMSGTASVVVRIEAGKGKRWPIVQYDVAKDKLTANGKRCKGVK